MGPVGPQLQKEPSGARAFIRREGRALVKAAGQRPQPESPPHLTTRLWSVSVRVLEELPLGTLARGCQ